MQGPWVYVSQLVQYNTYLINNKSAGTRTFTCVVCSLAGGHQLVAICQHEGVHGKRDRVVFVPEQAQCQAGSSGLLSLPARQQELHLSCCVAGACLSLGRAARIIASSVCGVAILRAVCPTIYVKHRLCYVRTSDASTSANAEFFFLLHSQALGASRCNSSSSQDSHRRSVPALSEIGIRASLC